MRGILIFRGCVLRSPNSHGKNTTKPMKERHTNSDHQTFLKNRDIRDKYVLELRNRFETLQEKTEKGTPNDEYENFVNAQQRNVFQQKTRTKSRVLGETLAVREKRTDVKTASKCNRKNPTNTNALKLKKAQNELTSIYLIYLILHVFCQFF